MTLFQYYVPYFSENPSLLAFLISLTIIAVFCNANVIIAIIAKKHLHTFANILAVSLALGDLLLATSLCFLQSGTEWNNIRQSSNMEGTYLDRCSNKSRTFPIDINIPTVTCYDDFTIHLQDLVSMVVTTTQMTVILHLLVITIDRYFAIVHPLTHYLWENHGMKSEAKAVGICIIIWLASFAFNVVYFIIFSGVTHPDDKYVTISYYIFITSCLIITFFLNIPIVMTAIVPTDLDAERNSDGLTSFLPQNRKLAVTFFLILTSISVGYTPDCVVYTLKNNNLISNNTFYPCYSVITIVKLITCIVNPIIYGLRTFKITFSTLCQESYQKFTSTLTSTTSVKTSATVVSKVSGVEERRTTFQHSSSLLFKKRRESEHQKKRAIPRLIVIGIVLIYLFASFALLFIKVKDQIEETKWPSDGALLVLGGCLFTPNQAGCVNKVADVEVLAAPDSLPENCTKPPPFPKASYNHGTVFFNNTILTCGGRVLHKKCYSWTPGSTHWIEGVHFLTTMMFNPNSVVTSHGAWFLDFDAEVSNVLTHTDGQFTKGPPPSLKPRINPCITSHSNSDGDTIVVIGGYAYGRNSTVEMYDAYMTFWKYLPDLNEARQSHSCGSIGNFLVVAGGITLDGPVTNTVEVLNLAADEGSGWTFYSPLTNKMFDGVMANLFGSIIIVGGTEDVITADQQVSRGGHNTSITNHVLLDYPFEHSTNVGIMTTREQGHTVVPISINELCYTK